MDAAGTRDRSIEPPTGSREVGQLVRLREQLAAREQVIVRLNRRLLELESGSPEDDVQAHPDDNLVAVYQHQLHEVGEELRRERRESADRVAALEQEVQRLRLQVGSLEALRVDPLAWALHRARALLRRVAAR